MISELSQLEDLNTNRITRILTTDFPQYFAIVSRIRQEVHAIGPEGKCPAELVAGFQDLETLLKGTSLVLGLLMLPFKTHRTSDTGQGE